MDYFLALSDFLFAFIALIFLVLDQFFSNIYSLIRVTQPSNNLILFTEFLTHWPEPKVL